MLKVDGYDIYFRHKTEEWGVLGDTPYRACTDCIIEKDKQVVATNSAYCSMEDVFDKAKGRKISLARTLVNFDKEFRTNVWKAYIKETSRL